MPASTAVVPHSNATELTGNVRSILWSNWSECAADPEAATQGFVIARLTDDSIIKGPCPEDGIEVGMAYRFLGRWVAHHQYGKQFQYSTFCRLEPMTRIGVIRYLVKLAPNIGEVKASKLWDALGSACVQCLREHPEGVAKLGILTLEQAVEAADALAEFAGLEQTRIDLFGLFDRRGFPGKLIEAAIIKWGARAGEKIRKNPYALLVGKPRLPGCGWRRVDKLFLDLGGDPTRLKRQMLAAWNALREDSSGHTWFHQGIARDAVRKAVGSAFEANPPAALKLGVRARWLAVHTDASGQEWIAETRKAANERKVAEKVLELTACPCQWWNAAAEIVPGVLSEHQIGRLKTALHAPVGILAGTPGTGKTFTAAQVVKYLACRFGLDAIAVCAPTGKAAVRATSAMHHYGIGLDARTIHRTLGVSRNGHDGDGWGFGFCESMPLPYRFIVVDEASMVDTDIAAALLSACAPGTHVLFVGDPYQLPPVGHGAPLRDLIAAGVPCGELAEIRRNSGLIVEACARIKDGKAFDVAAKFEPPVNNLRHLGFETPQESIEALKAVLAKFAASGKFNPVWDVQVLVAVNDRAKSAVARKALNPLLQGLLNPSGATASPNPFRVGDKIICTKNTKMPTVDPFVSGPPANPSSYRPGNESEFVANGELGKVIAVGPKVMIARFTEPNRLLKIPLGAPKERDEEDEGGAAGSEEGAETRTGTGCDFDLGYALTTHKSQGSEWPVAIVMIDDSPAAKRVCSREHIYTAVSRAKQLAILIGKMPTLEIQMKRVSLAHRKTFLAELLKEGLTK